MSTLSVFDELDQAIDEMIAASARAGAKAHNGFGDVVARLKPCPDTCLSEDEDGDDADDFSVEPVNEANVGERDQRIEPLLAVASDLLLLPSQEFKTRLKAELLWTAQKEPAQGSATSPSARHNAASAAIAVVHPETEILPTLFGRGYGAYPVRRSNFVTSVALHLAAVVAMLTGFWMVQHRVHPMQAKMSDSVSLYVPPLGSLQPNGGGGGGDRSLLPASKGMVKAAPEQIVPPTTHSVLQAQLTVDPTVVVPNVKLPDNDHTGVLNGVLAPSDGTGSSSGIGAGSHGGVGAGIGNGVGPGFGGGVGGGYYRIGNGVSAPRVVYDPDPEYSEEARKAHFQGTVVVWAIVGPDGHVREARVQRPVGLGLDEKALEVLKTWRFDPATKDGHPVPVAISIEVGFRLY